jgi:RNA methyltransferase, TrmH family
VKQVTSDANPAFRRWLRIATTPRAVRAGGQTLAEGVHLAQTALAAGTAVDAIVLRRGRLAPPVQTLSNRFAAAIPRFELAAELYERIAGVEHGAGLLLALPVPSPRLPRRAPGVLVYLDGVQDPGNVGAIIRTAAAAGVTDVIGSTGTASLWAPKVLRAAMGAHFRIGLHEHVAPEQLPEMLDGEWIAAVAHDAASLWDFDAAPRALGWIFGAEGSGASPAALAVSRWQLRIPTSSAVESLNVAAAAAICLFAGQRRGG